MLLLLLLIPPCCQHTRTIVGSESFWRPYSHMNQCLLFKSPIISTFFSSLRHLLPSPPSFHEQTPMPGATPALCWRRTMDENLTETSDETADDGSSVGMKLRRMRPRFEVIAIVNADRKDNAGSVSGMTPSRYGGGEVLRQVKHIAHRLRTLIIVAVGQRRQPSTDAESVASFNSHLSRLAAILSSPYRLQPHLPPLCFFSRSSSA